ncbi:MAG: hypothetical protein ACXVKL_09685, partial [Candidatus Angelobacter sp.]
FASYRELRRTLQLTRRDIRYRVELFYHYSNDTNPWEVEICSQQSGTWKQVVDFPYVQEREEEAALRAALSFIHQGKAS